MVSNLWPRPPKDVLVDSDTDEDVYDDEGEAGTSQKTIPRGRSGTKRTRSSQASCSDNRGKRKKDSLPKDNKVDKESPSDLTPLTIGDIPAIVSAVLLSITSTDADNDNESRGTTLSSQLFKFV